MSVLSACLVLGAIAMGGSMSAAVPSHADREPLRLPPDLLIGAGGCAFQMDGAWDADGKGESSIDHTFHYGNLTHLGFDDPHATDVAADSYHRYKEDIAAAAELKLQLYRFSFSWPRVLPDGDASRPNKAGVEYYHKFIDELLKHNIEPFATVYHFEHPQIFEDQFKGWQSPEMVKKFREYAAFLFTEFGSKIKLWGTVNEPNVVCTYFTNMTVEAGLESNDDLDTYRCVHHVVLAHGHARQEFIKAGSPGLLGYNNWFLIGQPRTNSEEDVYATEVYNEVQMGVFMHPLVYGDYPETVKQVMGHVLYNFTDEEKEMLKGSTDFISVNIYSGAMVRYKDPKEPKTWFPRSGPAIVSSKLMEDIPFLTHKFVNAKEEETVVPTGTEIAPKAMHRSLLWTWEHYKLPIIISENGLGVNDDSNQLRAAYHSQFIRSMVSTINEYGVKVIAYCAWSLIDNWEWSDRGYETKFGLVHVDYDHGSLNRTVKPVVKEFFVNMIDTRTVPFIEEPDVPTSASPALRASAVACFVTAFAFRWLP